MSIVSAGIFLLVAALVAHAVVYPASGAVTANEIHIPTGRRVLARIESADVIHDFWVPALARKIDMIPGRENFVWLEAVI